MSNENTAILTGNVTRDPELKYTATGQAVATFGLAVNRKWRNRQTQEWEESVSYFDVTCWRDLAENVAESITKGARVVVVGHLEQRTWETSNGEKRSKVELQAHDVGASLSWATAVVTRNERKNEATGNPVPNVPPAYDYDEEPF